MANVGDKVLILEGPFEDYKAVITNVKPPESDYRYTLRVMEFPDGLPIEDDNQEDWTYECDDHEFEEVSCE
jgi:transcription antitermination factor NusG